MTDIKHIRRDFHLVAWVMPQGSDLGVPWGGFGGQFFSPKIQPDLVCELLTWMAYVPAPFFGSPPPGALGRDQKVNYHLIWITKFFKPNFVYLLTKERYIKYQTGFSFGRLGHAKGWDLGVPWGVGGQIFFSRNSTRCGVWVTHMNGTCTGTIIWVPAPWGLGEGSKTYFLNMVMWNIKLKGMSSRPRYTEQF